MFTNTIRIITGLFMSLLTMTVQAQEITMFESQVKLSKEAKKSGSYFGGGYDQEKKQVITIMSYPDKDEGTLFDIYRFDEKNKPLAAQVGLDVMALAENLNYESTDTDQKENVGAKYDGSKVILVRSNFIGRDIVIEKGKLAHERETFVKAKNPNNPFSTGKAWIVDRLLYKKDSKEKIDMDMMPMGTLVSKGQYDPDVLTKIQQAPEEGIASSDEGVFALGKVLVDQAKTGVSAVKAGLNSAFMQEGGQAVVIGRVVEKVSIKDPVPWNNNRLRVATVDGATMTAEEKTTFVMPFAFIPAQTKAIDNFQKMVALLVPLNSPNTVKEAKQYQMDKENRNRVMVTIVNAQGEVVDTTEYRSKGNNGKYAIQERGNALYFPAVVDAGKSGFYNGLVNKPTHFQITKVEGGAVAYNQAFNFDEIGDKVVVAKGEKFKKLKVGDIQFQGHEELDNGDMVFFAIDESNFYAFQVDGGGDLKQLYLTERYDPNGKVVDSRFIRGPAGNLVWMTRETPEGIVDTEFDLSTSSWSSGLYTYTVTTAQPRNVREIKAVIKVAAIDPVEGKLGAQKVIGGKDYLVVGDAGFLMNNEGDMVMIGYDMEKKKTLYAIKLSN